MLPPPEPERGTNWVPIVVTLILIALLGALLWFLAANVLNNDDQQTGVLVTVPNVVGEKRAQAISDLQDNGLAVGTITPVPAADDTQDPGTVLEQDPAAGAEVDRGSKVNLTIVAAPDTVPIPNLEGASVAGGPGHAASASASSRAGRSRSRATPSPTGDVTRTDPAPGRRSTRVRPVTIFVSTGPEQVVRARACGARASARPRTSSPRPGLSSVISSETVRRQPARARKGNKVAAQDPAPGTQVDPGTTVTLFQGAEGPTGPTGATP